jgi:hypothetical protein
MALHFTDAAVQEALVEAPGSGHHPGGGRATMNTPFTARITSESKDGRRIEETIQKSRHTVRC